MGLNRVDEAAEQAQRVPNSPFYERLAGELRQPKRAQKRVKLPVPYIEQGWNTCAPATLSAITSIWGAPIPQDTLIGEICYDGTYDFVERSWGRRRGLAGA